MSKGFWAAILVIVVACFGGWHIYNEQRKEAELDARRERVREGMERREEERAAEEAQDAADRAAGMSEMEILQRSVDRLTAH